MQITVNGEPRQIDPDTRLAQLLKRLAPGEGRIAVELNGEIVPRSRFGELTLKTGDRIEIVQAIGGG